MARSVTKRLDAFSIVNYVVMSVVCVITVYPFWDVLIVSISSFKDYGATAIHLWPRNLDLSSYRFLFGMKRLWTAYQNTIFIAVVGTALSVVFTTMTSYAVSKKIKGMRVVMFLLVFTMLFDGGIIPRYIVVRKVGIMNTLWAMIIPVLIGTWYVIIMRNYFFTVPAELEESARMDGASDLLILARIVVPISMPVIATISLFYAVYYWNSFFSGVMYISDFSKWPLQLFLRAMLFENEADTVTGGDNPALLGMPIKMAAIIAAALPVMLAYPFFQRFFVRGILIGAVKG
jgi:putative aldouronate transport system permease protein